MAEDAIVTKLIRPVNKTMEPKSPDFGEAAPNARIPANSATDTLNRVGGQGAGRSLLQSFGVPHLLSRPGLPADVVRGGMYLHDDTLLARCAWSSAWRAVSPQPCFSGYPYLFLRESIDDNNHDYLSSLLSLFTLVVPAN